LNAEDAKDAQKAQKREKRRKIEAIAAFKHRIFLGGYQSRTRPNDFDRIFVFLSDFLFCVFCATFAPSAFKNGISVSIPNTQREEKIMANSSL
jgi:hypothetical protein